MATVVIVNALTSEVVEREQTAEEKAQSVADTAEAESRIQAEADKAKTKQTVLDRLGITADEAALLLG